MNCNWVSNAVDNNYGDGIPRGVNGDLWSVVVGGGVGMKGNKK